MLPPVADATIRVLAVEDEPIYAQALEMTLEELGYELLPVVDNARDAERLFRDLRPDLVLLDIRLRGDVDGIELALRLNALRPVPLIFLTSFTDRDTFERAKAAGPCAYLAKPFDEATLERAMELAIQRFARPEASSPETAAGAPETAAAEAADPADRPLLVQDAFFVRENNRLHKIPYDGLLWAETDNAHVHLHTVPRKYTVRLSLRDLEDRLPPGRFVRIHRSFVVQAQCIESVDLQDAQVWVRGVGLPIGRSYREALLARLDLLG